MKGHVTRNTHVQYEVSSKNWVITFKPEEIQISYMSYVYEWAKHSWVINCTRCGSPRWPLTYWPEYQYPRDHLLINDFLPTKFEASGAKNYWIISCTVCGRPRWTFDLDLRPTDLNIIRDHLLIKDYLPTKFEASVAKPSCVISCTRLREIDIPMDMCKATAPPSSKGCITNINWYM